MMYVQDYDGSYPIYISYKSRPNELPPNVTWDLQLQPYLKNFGVARCPSDPHPAFHEYPDGSTVWRSYTTPLNMIWGLQKGLPFPRTEANVPQPADTLLMFEKNQGAEVNGWPYPKTRTPGVNWGSSAGFSTWQQCAWQRHGDRANALFADGHIKVLKGRNQGKFRFPPTEDESYSWPKLEGYVWREGAGPYFVRNANGNQFWENCPLPGEAPFTTACQ
jgi:prepilin-type processing-associated H-X9-DG protein